MGNCRSCSVIWLYAAHFSSYRNLVYCTQCTYCINSVICCPEHGLSLLTWCSSLMSVFSSVCLSVSLGHVSSVSFLQFDQGHSLSRANDPCMVQGKRDLGEKLSSAGLNRPLYTQTEDVMLFFHFLLSPVKLLMHIQQTIFPEFTVLWPLRPSDSWKKWPAVLTTKFGSRKRNCFHWDGTKLKIRLEIVS